MLNPGDVILVKPGETIPGDGVVLDGSSAANESLISGESKPVAKRGDSVIAGSVNTSSPLYVQISQTGQQTRLAGIVRLLDQALAEKPRLAVAADRFASWFVALLLLAAAGSYIAWHFIEPARALWIMVAVLVVSCPCALSLATPAALTAATGHLAALGLLTTRGHALETLARVSDVVFDKTGTLTHGDMRLREQMQLGDMPAAQTLAIAAALEQASEHPLAQAAPGRRQSALPGKPTGQHCRQGVEGVIDGTTWRLGSVEFINQWLTAADPARRLAADCTLVVLANPAGAQAAFAIGDTVRADAAHGALLQQRGISVHLLSGDGAGAVQSLADSWALPTGMPAPRRRTSWPLSASCNKQASGC
jgi:Cu2+-exporting ATPase